MYENRIRILNGQILDTKKTIGKSLEQRFWISFTLDQKTGWFSGTKKKLPTFQNHHGFMDLFLVLFIIW